MFRMQSCTISSLEFMAGLSRWHNKYDCHNSEVSTRGVMGANHSTHRHVCCWRPSPRARAAGRIFCIVAHPACRNKRAFGPTNLGLVGRRGSSQSRARDGRVSSLSDQRQECRVTAESLVPGANPAGYHARCASSQYTFGEPETRPETTGRPGSGWLRKSMRTCHWCELGKAQIRTLF